MLAHCLLNLNWESGKAIESGAAWIQVFFSSVIPPTALFHLLIADFKQSNITDSLSIWFFGFKTGSLNMIITFSRIYLLSRAWQNGKNFECNISYDSKKLKMQPSIRRNTFHIFLSNVTKVASKKLGQLNKWTFKNITYANRNIRQRSTAGSLGITKNLQQINKSFA